MSHYPESILNPENAFRSFKLFVNEIAFVDGVKKQYAGVVKDTIMQENAVASQKTIWWCVLPLPNSLNDSQSHKWGTEDGALSTVADNILGQATFKGVSAQKFAREIGSRTGQRQPAINPGYYQDYTGSDLRSFTFTWDLIPNNPGEAMNIKEILLNIKKYSSPDISDNSLAMLSPYTFDVEVGNPVIAELLKLEGVVITNVSIEYSADGAMQWLADGTPKHITLSISMAERELRTSEDY